MISLQQTLFSMVKTESIPPKIRNKTRVCTFTTIIQHSSGSPSYSHQRRERNKRNPDHKGRSKALTVGKWINWYIQSMECYSLLKRNELSNYEKTWRNLKCILLRERSQYVKALYCMIPTK